VLLTEPLHHGGGLVDPIVSGVCNKLAIGEATTGRNVPFRHQWSRPRHAALRSSRCAPPRRPLDICPRVAIERGAPRSKIEGEV